MNPKLTVDHLHRRALVYIRQSTPDQVQHHQESTRRQYGWVDQARVLGFENVVVIDEDLGRTGSGLVERPGFQRLVAEVCSGAVGAVLCIEASRLARNGRDWHYLIELCGMVKAVVIEGGDRLTCPRVPASATLGSSTPAARPACPVPPRPAPRTGSPRACLYAVTWTSRPAKRWLEPLLVPHTVPFRSAGCSQSN